MVLVNHSNFWEPKEHAVKTVGIMKFDHVNEKSKAEKDILPTTRKPFLFPLNY